jgi:Zn-dependent M28 family amino/carboxypeptidase
LPELAERLRKHVDLIAEVIGPRHLGRPHELAATAGYIEREFVSLNDTVERQDYEVAGMTATNLVVERPGVQEPASIFVLGAHYDSTPNTPGADDNASAVAVLIEVARILRGRASRRTVRFVAFTCEEPPHFYTDTMGSQVYARRCRARRESILGMLCLEMVGYYTDEPGSQRVPEGIPRSARWLLPRRGNFLASVGNMKSKMLAWNFHRGFKEQTRFPFRCSQSACPKRSAKSACPITARSGTRDILH